MASPLRGKKSEGIDAALFKALGRLCIYELIYGRKR